MELRLLSYAPDLGGQRRLSPSVPPVSIKQLRRTNPQKASDTIGKNLVDVTYRAGRFCFKGESQKVRWQPTCHGSAQLREARSD